ncbi:MAG: PilN domain-containing protein [Woeseiaceae bacterium]|nr:PilN domain-containing protein [Woeseiaceae bacterium]
MASIDLIPNDYRVWLSQRRTLRAAGIVLGATAALIFGGATAVGNAARASQQEAADLRVRNAITQQQQQDLQAMKAQQAEYERQWSLLRGLRAGAAVEDIFRIVDESLDGDKLWFVDWSFRRAGVIVDGEQRGVETGYFIIVSQEDGAPAEHDYAVETHMSIHGQAHDHQALSAFVRALFEQELIKDVSVQRTTRSDLGARRVVDFDITVVLNSSPRGS